MSCTESPEQKKSTPDKAPSAFENIVSEVDLLLELVTNNVIIIDSSSIETYTATYNLTPINNTYRSETSFENILLKRIFKCKANIISSIHFDFYYDSLNTELVHNTDTLLAKLVNSLGEFNSTNGSRSMKTYSWVLSNNKLDFEIFNNGYTITIRKNNVPIQSPEPKKQIAKKLELAELFIKHVHNDSLSLNNTNKGNIQSLFKASFIEKANGIVFSETYNENILLSGSFVFNEDLLEGVYFDYMYSDTTSKEFIEDAKAIRVLINDLYGSPSDVATVPLSTSYKWLNSPISLEVYGDGFSIIMEVPKL